MLRKIPSGFLVASIGTCSVLGPDLVSDGLILFLVSGISKIDVKVDSRADEDLRNLRYFCNQLFKGFHAPGETF